MLDGLLGTFRHSVDPSTGSRVLDSPFCRFVIRDRPDTIVCFSPINCPPGKFFGSKALAGMPANLVFLNCPANAWYLDGIPLLGSNLEESAHTLSALMTSLGLANGRRLFWGGSMGGFGAVAMGALVNADLVVATGAELDLFIRGGNSELILRRIQGRQDMDKPDIARMIGSSATRFFLYCGEFAYHDVASLALLRSCERAACRTLRDFGHPLPAHIQKTCGLGHFLAHHLEEQAPFRFPDEEAGILWRFPDWWTDLHAVAHDLSEVSVRRATDGLRDTSLPSELRAHMAHALSRMASSRGDTGSALAWSRQALDLGGTPSNFHRFRFACALRDAGAPTAEWLAAASSIHHAEDPDRLEFGDSLIRMIHDGMTDSVGSRSARNFVLEMIRRSQGHERRESFLRSLLGSDAGDPDPWRAELTGEATALATRSRIDRPDLPPCDPLLLSGFMFSLSDGDRLVSVRAPGSDAEILSQEFALESPGVSKLHPGIDAAGQCRFRVRLRILRPGISSITLKARTANGFEFDWLSLRRSPVRDPRSRNS